ncbi:MAG: alpha/beta fold hydrolase [Patescibacteria group bacterium]
MAERITFKTADDVIIVGDWYPTPTVLGAVLLLHMMPETRTSWALFARELAKRSIASLAIDLRGHGESTKDASGASFDAKDFEDEDHRASSFDVSGAIDWLRSRKLDEARIGLGGASFGADLALQQLAANPALPGAFLLSPGTYRGLDAVEMGPNLLPHQALYIVSSEDDAESFASSKQLYEEAPIEDKTFIPFRSGGHGTALFATDKTLLPKVAEWTAKMIRG